MSTTAKAKAFHQQPSHHQQSSSAATSAANKGLCSSSGSFNQNLSSTSLLLIDTSSPPLSVSDNGSVSSGNESSSTPLHHQNSHPRQQQTNSGPSSMIWVNGNNNPDSSSVNNSENQNNRGFTRPTGQGSTGYLRTSSEGNANSSVYSENQSPATSQRSSNSINIVTSSQNDYLRYSGTNTSGGILWPLPPITTNQQQIVSSPHCDTQSPSLTTAHQSSSNQSALIKNSQNLSQNNNGDHHGNQINVNSKSNKKESHNRIERKRRDYINTQIASLGTLLPQELYRGVDGKRNKGSVLKLSVNYIQELRSQLSRMNSIQEENQLARQLIPVILQRVKFLEKTMTNLLNECFTNGNIDQSNNLTSEKSQIKISDQIEKKYLKFQKLLYEAISNRFDSVNSSGESSGNVNSSAPLKWDPETFEGIERENQSILENEVVQAWLRVFENNKSSEIYPSQSIDNNKSDYHPNGLNDRDDTFFQNCLQDIQITNKRMTENSILTGTKHRFMNDNSAIAPSVAKSCRRSTRHANNMSNCSSEASNTDESSPLSNMATSCPVEHRLFYASNQGNSSNNDTSNNNCLDGNQSLLLTYPGSTHDQNGNTTDFSLGQIQTSDILLTNSHGNNCSMNSSNSGSNHCIVMRNDKVSDDMLCQSDSSVIDNPIILSTFFGPNAYEQNISSNQALLTSEQLHQLNNNHYQMLLHQHQTPSDHQQQQQENNSNSRNGQSNSSDNHYHHINIQHQHHQLSTHLQSTRPNQSS